MSPRGAGLTDANALSEIAVNGDKVFFSINVEASEVKAWEGVRAEAEWRVGGPWKLVLPDRRVADTGEILEFEPPRRLAIKWKNEFMPELTAEGWSHCLFELEPMGEAVKLSVAHSVPVAKSKLIQAVSGGWPQILSNLKTLLETGKPLIAQRAAEATSA